MSRIDTFCNLLGADFTPALAEHDATRPEALLKVPHPIFGHRWRYTQATPLVAGTPLLYTEQGSYTREQLLEYPFVWEGKWMSPPPGVVELAMSREISIDYSYATDHGSYSDNFTIPARGRYERIFLNEEESPAYDEEGEETENVPQPAPLAFDHRWMENDAKTQVEVDEKTLQSMPHLSRSLLSKPNPLAISENPYSEIEQGYEGGLATFVNDTTWEHDATTADGGDTPEEIPTGVFYPEGLDPSDPDAEPTEPIEFVLLFFPGDYTNLRAQGTISTTHPLFVAGMNLWIVPTFFQFGSSSSSTGDFGYFDRSQWSADDLEKIDKIIADKVGETEQDAGFYGIFTGGDSPYELPGQTEPITYEAEPDRDVEITIIPGETFRPDFLTWETE